MKAATEHTIEEWYVVRLPPTEHSENCEQQVIGSTLREQDYSGPQTTIT